MVDEIKAAIVGAGALALGYALWIRSLRHRNLIRATATSRIATAATGFVELNGVARPVDGETLRDPIQHIACLWYYVVTEERDWRDRWRWKTVSRDASSRHFVIEDDSGACTVATHEADIDRAHPDLVIKERWNRRHRIWRIEDGDPIYALGHIDHTASVAHAAAAAATPARVTTLLRQWKADQPALLARFDADGDGRIDAHEWESARGAALAEARERETEQLTRDEAPRLPSGRAITHFLRRPSDGRPLLLSKRSEEQLARAKALASFSGVALFAFGVGALLVTLRGCLGG